MDFRRATELFEAFRLSHGQQATAKQKPEGSQTADGFSSQAVDLGNLKREKSVDAEKRGVRDVTFHTLFYPDGVPRVKMEISEKAHNQDV